MAHSEPLFVPSRSESPVSSITTRLSHSCITATPSPIRLPSITRTSSVDSFPTFYSLQDPLPSPKPHGRGRVSSAFSPSPLFRSIPEELRVESPPVPPLSLEECPSCRLATIPGSRPDLCGIIKDKQELITVDCRFPYEYDGGHIQGAVNLHTRDKILEYFFYLDTMTPKFDNPFIVFYCEFSSLRGPDGFRFLRGKDRSINVDRYPSLFYTDMYLLEGGYREFFSKHLDFCTPTEYVTMRDHRFSQQMQEGLLENRSGRTKQRPTTPTSNLRVRAISFEQV